MSNILAVIIGMLFIFIAGVMLGVKLGRFRGKIELEEYQQKIVDKLK